MRIQKLTSVLVVFGIILFVVSPIEAATVAYWRFENGIADNRAILANSILDSSGHGMNGTPVNMPRYRTSVFGTEVPLTGANNALSMEFDGTDQRIYVPDNSLFQLTHSLTLEAYINVNPILSGNIGGQIIFRGDDRSSLDPYTLTINAINWLEFEICSPNGTVIGISTPIPFGQWMHVAGTLNDSTGQLALYVNGQLANSTITSLRPLGALNSSYSPGLGIGNVQSGNYGEFFNGLIDEVRISDVALTPDQFLNVPEPSTLIFLSVGAISLLAYSWRRRAT